MRNAGNLFFDNEPVVPGFLFCLFALEGMVRADPAWML